LKKDPINDLKELDIGCFSNLTRHPAEIKYPRLFEDPAVTFWILLHDAARLPGFLHRTH